jgi:hypothetical protein
MSSVSLSAPQTLNLYTYCGNDPINHTDTSGLFRGFFRSLFKWILVAIAVVIAVLTIIAMPPTLAGILGVISAGANAAAQVANAAGFKKIGMIFGLIAAATGFGSIIAGKIGPQHLLESQGKERTFGFGVWYAALGGVGAINNFAQTKRDEKKGKSLNSDVCNHWIDIYYSLLKPHFDRLWEKAKNSKTSNAEAGGVIYFLGRRRNVTQV